MPKNIDVVYILKKNTDPQELIYSLRSLKNFPHRKVWFVGGQPDGLYPDGRIKHEQTGVTKWERVRSSLIKITECDEITDDFYLFNDDFFVMKCMESSAEPVPSTQDASTIFIRIRISPTLSFFCIMEI